MQLLLAALSSLLAAGLSAAAAGPGACPNACHGAPPPPPMTFDSDVDDVDQQLALPAPDLGEQMRYLEDKVMKLEGRLTVLGDQHLELSSALPHLASAVAAQNERLDKLTSTVNALWWQNCGNKA